MKAYVKEMQYSIVDLENSIVCQGLEVQKDSKIGAVYIPIYTHGQANLSRVSLVQKIHKTYCQP